MSKCMLCGNDNKTEKLDEKFLSETFLMAYVISMLTKPITEMNAYKHELINEDGRILKKPETIAEKNSLTPIDNYVLNMKKLLGNKLDLLNNGLYLEKIISANKVESVDYRDELELKKELKISIKRFMESLDLAKHKNIPTTLVEKLILDTFKELC